MIGATTTGGMTTGENIANVAKTVLGIPGLYKQSQAAQLQAPFDAARQIAALQDDQTNMQVKLAQAYHLYATGKQMLDKPTKAYNGQVYQDKNNRPYQINTITGEAQALDGKPDPLAFDGSTKVGTPPKPNAPGAPPKGVSSQAERLAWQGIQQEYKKAGKPEPTSPADIPDWQRRVANATRTISQAGGYGGAAGRGAGSQDTGSLSESDRTYLKSLEDDAKQAEAKAKEKLSPSQFSSEADPLKARDAEVSRRQQAAKAARQKYNNAASQVQQAQPNSKIKGGASGRPTVEIDSQTGNVIVR